MTVSAIPDCEIMTAEIQWVDDGRLENSKNMIRNKKIVPALMFHSVGLEWHPWVWAHISEAVATFEKKIALLNHRGFHGIFWNELYEYMAGKRSLPDNSILLTFDDGYLDNWVYVYPILKKYRFKGTIFVNPEFVDTRPDLRLNTEDVAESRCRDIDLQHAGMLSWNEMTRMEESGLVDVQSHSMSHTWFFSGPKITDIHRPTEVTPYPWLFWNSRPDRKPYYLTENQQEFLPWGHPILAHQKSLVVRRYFPEESAIREVTQYVGDHGGAEFFNRTDWRDALVAELGLTVGESELGGEYETQQAQKSRVTGELRLSKELIERNLNKQVDFICWPGGGNDDSLQRTALEAGYKAWTLSSNSEPNKRNLPGANPSSIKRIGTSNDVAIKGRQCGTGGAYFQLYKILEHQRSSLGSLLLKAYKLVAFVANSWRG